MDNKLAHIIKNDPVFQHLVAVRTRFSVILSVIMLTVYFGFILTIAFAPKLLGVSLYGGVITVGIPVGLAIIILAFVLTGIYVNRANKVYDKLTERIVNREEVLEHLNEK